MLKVILVTGGAGFIGSHLCAALLKSKKKVYCVDNLITGNKHNLDAFKSNPNFTFLKGDICSDKILSILKNEYIDQIYHLSSPASVDYVVKYPVEAAISNGIGTRNVLELAKLKRARVLFASSSEVYGDPLIHPQKENYWGNVNPIGIRSGYDEGKRFGEALCMAYRRQYKVDTKIVRIFNTYGPNSSKNDGRVIPRLITQALKNYPLTIHGNGLQTRSFCYVSDTVEGLLKVMESPQNIPFNIGNPDEYSILNISKIILTLTNSKSKIKFTKRPSDDPSNRKPDISFAQKELQWTPKISFEKGLMITINYFKEILSSSTYE